MISFTLFCFPKSRKFLIIEFLFIIVVIISISFYPPNLQETARDTKLRESVR